MDRGAQFTYEGLEVLFDYLTSSEEDDTQLELDVIGFCCDFVESTLEEINSNYSDEETLNLEDAIEYLEAKTTVCGKTSVGTIVFQQF
jgi:hypothetical protein